ncbi:transcription factor [Sorochytrium milnesiophthora]
MKTAAAATKKTAAGAARSCRIAKTCQLCKRRKRMCDGGRPCERCKQAGAECIYLQEQKRGPKKKKSSNAAPPRKVVGPLHGEGGERTTSAVGAASSCHDAADLPVDSLATAATVETPSSPPPMDPLLLFAAAVPSPATDTGSSSSNSSGTRSSSPQSSYPFDGETSATSNCASDRSNSVPDALPANPAFDARLHAAALGIDLDALLGVFFKSFNRFMPVFTEDELRLHIGRGEAPDHLLYALAAISATYSSLPRVQRFQSDAPAPQVDLYIRKAQDMLVPRMEKLTVPSLFDAYSCLLLGMAFMTRGIGVMGASYINMSQQSLRAILAPTNNVVLSPAPTARQTSLLFWSLWVLDRKAVLFSTDRTVRMTFDSCPVVPDLPDLPTSPQSLFNASLVFAAYIRVLTLNGRIVQWFRDSAKDKRAQHARMRAIAVLPQESSETVQTLVADLAAFTSVDSFPPPYLIADADVDLQPLFDRMTDLESHFWVMTNLMYRLCTLYFDMDARHKWHTIELIAKISSQTSVPFSSFIVRVAMEAAEELIRAGHVRFFPSPALDLAGMLPSSTITSLVHCSVYPTLDQVVAWHDKVLNSSTSCLWWVRDDVLKLKAVVNGWRQLLYHQAASAVLAQFDDLPPSSSFTTAAS